MLVPRRAGFREALDEYTLPRISVICNVLHADLETSPKKSPKYKKVGKPTKDRLV